MGTLYLQAPSKIIKGEITLPSSKSISNRLLIIQALCEKEFPIINISDSSDTIVLQNALKLLDTNKIIDVGDAGTTMRFLTAYLANKPGEYVMTGSERMKQRPIGDLVNALNSIGAEITFLENQGYPPIRIKGKELDGGSININASISSQFVSALMMVAPFMKNDLTINLVGEIASFPYINMTYELMRQFGIDIVLEKNQIFIKKGNYQCNDEYKVEPDWTSASYFYSILALAEGGEFFFPGLLKNTIQGDAVIINWFEELGIQSTFSETGVSIKKFNKQIKSDFNFNFKNNPDIAQTMAVCLAGLNVNADFTGIESLKIKETDRILALQNELRKTGCHFLNKGQNIWALHNDNSNLELENNLVFETYKDHRMAMAFCAFAMLYKQIGIKNPDVVNKSFPKFWTSLKKTGFSFTKIES
jgi:3-phosphoshikimate 1-carboxyvinyltransferase